MSRKKIQNRKSDKIDSIKRKLFEFDDLVKCLIAKPIIIWLMIIVFGLAFIGFKNTEDMLVYSFWRTLAILKISDIFNAISAK